MTIRYFPDTDTALIEFTARPVTETRELSENLYLDVDKDGNPVNLTIEHAKETGSLSELVYREMTPESA